MLIDNTDLKILEELGLTKKEARVYLACLELGVNSVLNIAKKAGVKRPSAYIVLDSLIEKRMVTKVLAKKGIFYSAENPQKILTDLDRKRQDLKDMLPLLKAVHKKGIEKPQVRFYEGKDEMKKVYEEDIYLAKEILFYGSSMKDFVNEFPGTIEKGKKLFKRNKSKIREIVSSDSFDQKYAKKYNNPPFWQIIAVSEGSKFFADNIIWKNKVAIVSLEKLFMLVIESEDIANTYRTIFELMWKGLRK